MRVWALSDLHLSTTANKPMDIFGDHWADHAGAMAKAWDAAVAADDIVVTPGDFSWAGKPAEVAGDMAWLGARPGWKVLVKGNHDHWWPSSRTKMQQLLPPQCHALKKTACIISTGGKRIGICGVRGGDFAPLRRYGDTRSQADVDINLEREERELLASIQHLGELCAADPAPLDARICLFHYPPLPPGGTASRFSPHIAASGATLCVYGHLHGPNLGPAKVEGTFDGVRYVCASCDQIGFAPLQLLELT